MSHVAHNFHGAATQHVRWADHQREADVFGNGQGLRISGGNSVFRLLQLQLVHQRLEALAIFGQIDGVWRGAKDWNAFSFQRVGEFQRGLAAKLHNHAVQRAVFLLNAQDFHHMLKGEWLKIQAIRGVIVGRHSLWVAVDHDGFIALLGQRVAGMTAAVIKLDTLADPVWTATKDHNFLAIRWAGLTFHVAHHWGFVGGVHVRGLRLKFRRAGVDAFEHGGDAKGGAGFAHISFRQAGQDR